MCPENFPLLSNYWQSSELNISVGNLGYKPIKPF